MSPIRTALAIAGACALATTGVDLATSQEVKQEARPAARPSLTPSNVTQDMLNRAASDGNNFLHTNGDYAQKRYHPAAQINAANVSPPPASGLDLQTDVKEVDGNLADRRQRRHVCHDLVQPRATRSTRDRPAAVVLQAAARTDHRPIAAARTIAASRSLGDKVYLATLDAKLVALDAKTGNKVLADARSPIRNSATARRWRRPSSTARCSSAPTAANMASADFVKAYDAKTGKLLWTFDAIPENSVGRLGEEGRHRPRHASRHRGRESSAAPRPAIPYKTLGGGVWQNPAVDLATNRIFFVVGNPSPDLDGSLRPGDNLYTNSLVVARSRHRQIRLPLPVHRPRRLGSGRGQPAGPGGRARQERQS